MKSEIKKSIELEIRQDGIYLTLDKTLEGGVPSRVEVLKIIEDYGVQELDFSSVNEIFKATESIVTKKISSNVTINQEPEGVVVTVEKGGLSAFIKFTPPVNNGAKATKDSINNAIAAANIRYGVLTDAIDQLLENKVYGQPYLIAAGIEPIEGKDGYLEMHFDTSSKTRKPKELEDGRVDYRNLNLIEMTTAGDKLVTGIPEETGTDGMDVHGVTVPARKVKPTPPLPRGKNTAPSEDGTCLHSEINGQIVYDGKRVNVLPILDIGGNVDNSTGDINFNGGVIIRGNVLTGFSVVADGDIEVHGVVEGALIKAEGNVVVSSGVQGQDKAYITAGGNITVKYAESCTLSAENNIFADNIMHSLVKCGSNLELKGKKGLLVGGKTMVGKKLIADIIGSTMATATEIEVGFNPEVLEQYKAKMSEYNSIKTEYDKMNTIVDSLSALNEANPLSEDRKKILLKSVHTKMYLRDKLVEAQDKIDQITPLLQKSNGKIMVSNVIRTGVKVTIGNAVMYVRDDIVHCSLANVESKITIGPFD